MIGRKMARSRDSLTPQPIGTSPSLPKLSAVDLAQSLSGGELTFGLFLVFIRAPALLSVLILEHPRSTDGKAGARMKAR